MNLPSGTVKSRLSRATDALRAHLESQGDTATPSRSAATVEVTVGSGVSVTSGVSVGSADGVSTVGVVVTV